MADIPGYTKYEKCPVYKGCLQKNVFLKEDTKNEYYFITSKGDFRRHYCRVSGPHMPPQLFCGKFMNMVNGKIRYVGPARTRESAMNPPQDKNYKPTDWTFVDLYRADAAWVREPKPHD